MTRASIYSPTLGAAASAGGATAYATNALLFAAESAGSAGDLAVLTGVDWTSVAHDGTSWNPITGPPGLVPGASVGYNATHGLADGLGESSLDGADQPVIHLDSNSPTQWATDYNWSFWGRGEVLEQRRSVIKPAGHVVQFELDTIGTWGGASMVCAFWVDPTDEDVFAGVRLHNPSTGSWNLYGTTGNASSIVNAVGTTPAGITDNFQTAQSVRLSCGFSQTASTGALTMQVRASVVGNTDIVYQTQSIANTHPFATAYAADTALELRLMLVRTAASTQEMQATLEGMAIWTDSPGIL
jgi:hypothetical protein